MRSNRVLTAIVFLVGCATGGVASHAVAPPAIAQDISTQAWEYQCLELEQYSTRGSVVADQLSSSGMGGWELVALVNGFPCMKRPMR
jgi:hypothetical protein